MKKRKIVDAILFIDSSAMYHDRVSMKTKIPTLAPDEWYNLSVSNKLYQKLNITTKKYFAKVYDRWQYTGENKNLIEKVQKNIIKEK